MPPEPIDYDSLAATLRWDLAQMRTSATSLVSACDEVAAGMKAINTAVGNLALGWAGTTAAEVADFNARWQAVAASLFGTDSAAHDHQPTSADGVLSILAGGLHGVAEGVVQAEDELTAHFTAFANNLSSAGSTPSDSAPPPIPSTVVTAVDETWAG